MAKRKSMGQRRGRKRKHCDSDKENVPVKIRIDRTTVQLDQKQWMPAEAVQFFSRHKNIDEKLNRIESSVELVGPFRVLRGELQAEGVDLIMLDRDKLDLPEAQVFMTCTAGRYAFWRDTPYEDPKAVVFIDRRTIPDPTVIGSTVAHALLHFVDLYSNFKDVKVSRSVFRRVLGFTDHEMSELSRGRATDVNTQLCSGDYGGEILRLGNLMGFEQQSDVVNLLSPFYEKVDECNRQKEYEKGLRLGHLLFLANRSWYQQKSTELLTFAYEHLGRRDFTEILKLTLELRD